MAQYDPKIIQDHADQLYAQADKAPWLTAYAAGLVGLVTGLGSVNAARFGERLLAVHQADAGLVPQFLDKFRADCRHEIPFPP